MKNREASFVYVFGNRIGEILEESGCSIEELCEQTEISKSTMYRYINNEVDISFKNACKIAFYLEVELNDILPFYAKRKHF